MTLLMMPLGLIFGILDIMDLVIIKPEVELQSMQIIDPTMRFSCFLILNPR